MAAVNLSQWAQELVDHLSHHMDSERDALSEYRTLVESADDPRVQQLAMQILDDEVRHHRQFEDMRLGLRDEIEQRLPPVERPRLTDEQREALLRRTDELLALERDDVKELRRLAKRLRAVADTEWRAGIVEAMELDNRKHILLLEQIRKLLQ